MVSVPFLVIDSRVVFIVDLQLRQLKYNNLHVLCHVEAVTCAWPLPKF